MSDGFVDALSMQPRSIAIALVAALLAVSAGTGGALAVTDTLHAQQSPAGTTDAGTATGDSTSGTSGPSVTFDDQNSSGESVLVSSATLPEKGFVAIYDSSRSGNETNQVIGASYPLSAGTSDNIRIQLDEPVNGSKSLTAVVHTDSNGNDQFDFVSSNGQQDPPLTQGDRRVVDIAQVTVEDAGNAGAATGTASGDSAATDTGGDATGAGDADSTEANANASGNESGGNGSGNGSSSSGPGFGLAIAVVALLAVALLATRRN
jgi:PGF-CTERM protein